MHEHADLQRIAEAVLDRRLRLDLNQRDAAIRAGVSDATWSKVETGKEVGGRMLAKIGIGLGWEADTLARVGAGEDPPDEPLRLSANGASLDRLRDEDPDAYRQLDELARSLLQNGRR